MKKIISTILAVALCIISAFTVVGCSNTKTFKVVFDTAGGTRVSGGAIVQTVSKAEEIIPPILEKEGYTFVDWDADLSGIDKDTTVKAVWEKNKFTVTFSVAEGTYVEGSGAAIQTVKSGQELVLPEYTRIGYTLSWDKDLKEITDTCTVNGIWTANEYKLSFLNADGSKIEGVEDLKVTYDQKIPALPKLDDGEQRFVGWKNSAGVPVSEGQVWKYDKDISVKAVWTEFRKYAINLNLDGGELEKIPTVYSEGKETILPAPTKAGYAFAGWIELDANGKEISSAKINTVIDKGESGDKYFVATWSANAYKINFVDDNGNPISGVNSVNVQYGEKVPALPVVSNSDKKFAGWVLSNGEALLEGQVWKFDTDVTVKAVWTNYGEYSINVNLDGGEASSTLPYKYTEGKGATLGAVEREGYDFVGWVELNKDGQEISSAKKTVVIGKAATGDKYFLATWAAKEFTLSFVDDNGNPISGVTSIKVKYDEKIPTLPILSNAAQKFTGWKTQSGENVLAGQVWKYTDDVEVKAVWIEFSKFVINVNLDGGNLMNFPTTYTEGTGAIINAATRTGYTFIGWVELDENGTPISQPQTVVNIGKDATGDKSFIATWQVKSYTVNFASISGKVSVETMTFTYGQTITTLPTVTENGGTFVCWKYKGSEIKVGEQWLIDESGIEVNAEFIRKFVFTLKVDGYCGSKTVSGSLAEGTKTVIELNEYSNIELPNATPKDTNEYRFSSWKYKNDKGDWVKLASNTLINVAAFPGNDFGDAITINIELVAFYASNWTGFY